MFLALVAWSIGWLLTMVDDQYEASPIAERAVVSTFSGAFGVLLASPIIAVLSFTVAWLSWAYHGPRYQN